MTVVDLIMELSQLNPDLEVIYDTSKEGDLEFRMVVVQNAGEIETDKKEKYVLLNLNSERFNNTEEDDDDDI